MKVAILTQPLRSNYGGLLQAWALQKTITEMGHNVTIVNRVHGKPRIPLWRKTASRIKNEILIRLGKRKRYYPVTDTLLDFSEKNVSKFRENRYFGISPELKSNAELRKYINENSFDAYVVGSDQVWRPMYSPDLMTYFLDFVKDNNSVKKIAYAASFGVDEWEFSEAETKKVAELAPLFDLITVRESSGVDLVEKYFNCKATHVLDPTMLFDKEEYQGLINNSSCHLYDSNGELFCYVLDNAKSVKNAIEKCASDLGLNPYYCNYNIPLSKIEKGQSIEDCIVPPVEQWLKSFLDAKMVVTDSFHGVVFSIIFNKPFWVVINVKRGADRFFSLLRLFNLEDRIISEGANVEWLKPIDWVKINNLRSKLSHYSKTLLFSKL